MKHILSICLTAVILTAAPLSAADPAFRAGTVAVGTDLPKPPAAVNPPTGRITLDELLSVREGEGDWVRLFNGKDLSGFHTYLSGQGNKDPEQVFSVNDGMIHVFKDTPAGKEMPFGGVITDKDYGDYHLRFDFKWGTKKFAPRADAIRDAGLLFHCFGEDGAFAGTWAYSVECQIQEKDVGDLYVVGTRISTLVAKEPSEAGFVASLSSGDEVTVGERDQVARVVKQGDAERAGWNTVEVIARGDAAVFIVNGKPLHYIFDIRQPDLQNEAGWIPLTKGRLWFQAEGAEIMYRHIELRSLPPIQATSAAPPSATLSVPPPLSPAEALKKLHLPAGYQAEIIACEPLLIDPVAFDWDELGRLWVVEMADYPLGMDGKGQAGGRVRVLEDSDGDGRYDKQTLFADNLNFPNGILTWRDGVLITAAPNVLFLQDTDGDGRADKEEVLISGLQEGNQQLRANGLRWGLDNWVYLANGGHHGEYGTDTRLKSLRSGQEIQVGSRDFRFRPDTGELEPQSGPTQFGRNRDNWGRWFGTQNAHPLWHYVLPDHYLARNPHFGVGQTRVQLLAQSSPLYPASEAAKRYHDFFSLGHFTSACSGMIYRDRLMFNTSDNHAFICDPVHNLVQHVVLTNKGITFTAEHVPSEDKFDWFASEDGWCRPVMIREGPDGALWIADMYRYMIEHPQWLPQIGQDELQPHFRLGDDRGRIYRVSRTGMPDFKPVRFDNLSTLDLVAALDSSNGWCRDKAHQVLLWRADSASHAPLRDMAGESKNPLARLHALCVLEGLGALQPTTVAQALGDDHPGVRENALRLAEPNFTPEVLAAAVRLVNDPDAKVRMQLAFSLGESKQNAAGEALGRLLIDHGDDPMMVAAVISSATPHLSALISAVAEVPQSELVDTLLTIALGLNDRDAVATLLAPTFNAGGKHYTPGQLAAFARLLDELAHRNSTLDELRTAVAGDALAELLDKAAAIILHARVVAADSTSPPLERIAATGLISRDPAAHAEALPLLTAWLDPQQPVDAQAAAIEALTTIAKPAVPAAFAQAWPAMGPATRQLALTAWMSREPWAFDLVQRLERKELTTSVLDTTQRALLIKHDSKRINQLARKVFNSASSSRSTIIENYRPALSLTGDPVQGHQVFTKVCAVCHKRGSDGQDLGLGPDLATVVQHPPEKLLASILDPSADIQPGFSPYTCTLSTGIQIHGLLVSETANSIEMKFADGKKKTVLRNQIEGLHGQNISFMPEGLEAVLNHQQMADLIAYLRTPVKNAKR